MDLDLLLIQRMKSGDNTAIESFIRKYYPQILQYCRLHVHDPGYAEDLTQETFEHFFRSLRLWKDNAGESLCKIYCKQKSN